VPGADLTTALWHVLQAHMAAEPGFKVIVFFTTARSAQFYANVMRAAGVQVRGRRGRGRRRRERSRRFVWAPRATPRHAFPELSHSCLPAPPSPPLQCLDLHSRLSQKQRDTAAATFAANSGVLLFASDVIARGLDFPDVTLVVQVGGRGGLGGWWLGRGGRA
jgi:superfamily II DNA/RNA helicase